MTKNISSIPRSVVQSPVLEQRHAAPLSQVAKVEALHPLRGIPDDLKSVITSERRKRASEGAIALQTILAKIKELEHAHIDALTELPDRAMFEQTIQAVAERESQNNNPRVVFSIIDLNGVKRVNEAIGHKKGGDPYIVGVVHAINSTLRPNDQSFRIGGDEIGVIRYDAPDNLKELDKRVKASVQNYPELINQNLSPELHTGISIGSRRYTQGDTADTWIIEADALLKADKLAFNAAIPSEVLAKDSRLI